MQTKSHNLKEKERTENNEIYHLKLTLDSLVTERYVHICIFVYVYIYVCRCVYSCTRAHHFDMYVYVK
jgi:hypothetical protein